MQEEEQSYGSTNKDGRNREISFSFSDLFSECFETRERVPEFKIFIAGRWRNSSSGRTLDVDSPIDNRVIAKVQSGNSEDVESAVGAAYAARNTIRAMPAIERIEIMNRAAGLLTKHRDEFASCLVYEAGKPAKVASGEVRNAENRIRMTMEEARAIFGEYIPGDWSEDTMSQYALIVREPLGVIACISPFNYPLYSVVAKIVPAVVSGNTAVVKPASDDPLVALLFARVLQEAGLPAGVLNVVTGSGRDVGNPLVSHDLVRMVTLTGSTKTGERITKVAGMKRLHLELGGKGSALIASDCDLSLAARSVLRGSFDYSGQRCDAISRVLVVDEVYDPFMAELQNGFHSWRLGDPRDEANNMGPLINLEASERIQSLVDDAVSKGATLIGGGGHHDCYFEPTILGNVPLDARIAWEETFGPVVTVIRVHGIDEAIEVSNKSRYGLDSCVFTNNLYTAWKVAKGLEEGSVTVNDAPAHGVGYFPFGGNKDSGMGREGVGYSIDEMTRIKTIKYNLTPAGLGKRRERGGNRQE